MQLGTKTFKRKKTFGSIIVAFLLGAQFLNVLLTLYLNKDTELDQSSGYLKYIFAIILSLFAIYCFITILIERKVFLFRSLFPMLILAGFLLTYLFAEKKSALSMLDFIFLCFFPLLVGSTISFEPKKTLKYLMSFLLFGLPILMEIFEKGNNGVDYDAVSMGTSYAILPIVMAGILHFIFFRKESTFLEKILYAVTFLYIALFIWRSYRGALISLVFAIFVGILVNFNKKNHAKKILFFALFTVLVTFIIIFKDNFVNLFEDILSRIGIKFAFLDKSVSLIEKGDITHGRLEIYRIAIEKILEAPLTGHGYATFFYYTDIVYPHNFFLQIMFDCGVLVGLFISGFLIVNGIKHFSFAIRKDKKYFAFILLVFCSSVLRVMFSAEIWRVIILWFFFGIISKKTDLI